MESVTMDVVAEENQEECLGIQDQASGQVQVSIKAEVSHCHLLAKRRTGLGMHPVTKNYRGLPKKRAPFKTGLLGL